MLHSMDRAWAGQVKLEGHLGDLRQSLALAVMQTVARDQEAMVYAQLGQQPLARTTEISLQPRAGTRSCLSAQPAALAFWTGTWPQVRDRVPEHCPRFYTPSAR